MSIGEIYKECELVELELGTEHDKLEIKDHL